MTIIPKGENFYNENGVYLATARVDIDGGKRLNPNDFEDCTIDFNDFNSRLPLTAAILRKFRGVHV